MTRKTRIAAALSAPIIGSLAFIGLAVVPAAPAGAASPITITSHSIVINLPPIYIAINNI
ncbi:MAG TPA: hypothetical protein VG298_00995 [Acidimicrobiales bacterium]|jgi:hypothetical protein|nr:hypothetical protein [Acidimicrobiales bacterium]